jgi:predicted TIM-barrel fold metal-dependent hydrolase
MKIIDFHSHFYNGKRADGAEEYLIGRGLVLKTTDGGLDGVLHWMKQANVAFSVNLPVAVNPGDAAEMNIRAATYNSTVNPVLSFAAIHPACSGLEDMLFDIKLRGFKGIKIHPQEQDFYPDEERMKKVYKFSSDNGLIVVAHGGAGAEKNFDRASLKGEPAIFRNVIDDYPGLKLVVAHMGGLHVWDDAMKYLCAKNVIFDTAYCSIMDDMLLKEIIAAHGAQKVLFGTDFPWQSYKETADKVKKAVASLGELELIMHKNAENLFGK